jgi:hypothetical protein
MTQYQKGDFVKVSNGQTEPPKHHKKKHRIWAFSNFDGYVWRDDGSKYVAVGDKPDSAVVFSFRREMVRLIERSQQ